MYIKKGDTLDVFFFLLCFTIYVSLNSITDLLFGIKQIASSLILLCCIVIILITRIPRKSFDSESIRLLYGFFITYYIIGFLTRFYYFDIEYKVTLSLLLNNFTTSLIVILTTHQYLYKRLVLDKKEHKVFNALYISLILSALIAIWMTYNGVINLTGAENINGARVTGTFNNPNLLGLVSNMGMLCTYYSMIAHKRLFVLKLLLIPVLFYISFLSLSRAAMITNAAITLFVLSWTFYKFSKFSKRARRRMLLIGALPIFLTVFIATNFEIILNTYMDHWQAKKVTGMIDLVFEGKFNRETTSHRDAVFKLGIREISRKPIFGNGLSYFQHFPENTGLDYGVHNTFLMVFGESGLFSFILFLSYIFHILIVGIRGPSVSGLLAVGFMLVWILQIMGNHNGLDDKMANILIVYSSMFLSFKSKYMGCTKITLI